MIPTHDQIHALWDKYHMPQTKRIHVQLVARVAVFFAKKISVNNNLLESAALLHDIDKGAKKLPEEKHPDTAVRILREEGYREVADVVVTHPLHAILDPAISPKTWEQKLLFLADKMVKYDIVGVDKRFALWNAEHLPQEAQRILDSSYPKVKELEQEVFDLCNITLDDVVKLA